MPLLLAATETPNISKVIILYYDNHYVIINAPNTKPPIFGIDTQFNRIAITAQAQLTNGMNIVLCRAPKASEVT